MTVPAVAEGHDLGGPSPGALVELGPCEWRHDRGLLRYKPTLLPNTIYLAFVPA